jgi:N-acyl-D-aspartate/D-glutamate deacylase
LFDVILRGGQIVDGTGAEPFQGDIGIAQGRITEIGSLSGEARQVIDVAGRVVSPGFIDVHTHLDVQGFWDPTLSPSPLHGVTSVIGGNCGFSVAPLDDQAGPYLMRMLSRVEGMPLASLESGVPWNWRSTGEYLDQLDGSLAINAGFMVMGEQATEREATDAEIDQMSELLRDGLRAGGIGFSSTWSQTHNDAEGKPVPSRWASAAELVRLSTVAGEFDGTSLEFLPSGSAGAFPADVVELMIDMTVAAQRPLNWNALLVTSANFDQALAKLEVGDRARAAGGKVVGLTMPDAPPAVFSFLSGFALDLAPGLNEFVFLPPEERLAILRDPQRREAFRRRVDVSSPYEHLVNWDDRHIVETFTPQTAKYAGGVIGPMARAEGRDSFELFMDIVAADDLRTTFTNPPLSLTRQDWEARAKIWSDPRAVIGASDAGAHLDMLAFFAYSTMLLEQGVRRQGVVSLEEAIRLITSVPADLYGFVDRGRLSVGAVADIAVFDVEKIALHEVRTRFDLPGGAGRLYAEADGVGHVLVAGTEVVRDGRYTGSRPGRILRSGVDTRTPSLN